MNGPRATRAAAGPGPPPARRADAGAVRLGDRDVAGLLLCGDIYGAPYDLVAGFLRVRPDRLRGIVARWRNAGYAATGRLGPGPAWCWLTRSGLAVTGQRYAPARPALGRLAHIRAVLAVRLWLQGSDAYRDGRAWWRSERRIRAAAGGRVGISHVPDAEVSWPDLSGSSYAGECWAIRRALLAEQIPASHAQAAEHRQRHRDRLTRELARIDLAQRSQITQIETLPADPANHAAQAMRARCYERFAELHHERETAQAQLAALGETRARDDDASLLDVLPILAGRADLRPELIQAALYQAFDIQALYNTDTNQVTLRATITSSTPQAVASILALAGNDPARRTPEPGPAPAPRAADSTAVYPSAQRPIARLTVHV